MNADDRVRDCACPPTSAAPSRTWRRSTKSTGALRLGKTLTTPARLVNGIETGVGKAGSQFSAAQLFLHGTTIAINTILERKGATCALLTTQGFRDIYEIGRVNRPEAYNLFFQKHMPLIDRDMRFEILERMDAPGAVLIPLDEEQVRTVARNAVNHGVDAVAILFLHSYRNPAHEQRAKTIVEEANSRSLFVTSRTNCARNIANTSALRPPPPTPTSGRACSATSPRWTRHLKDTGFGGNFLVVQSTGGLFDVAEAGNPASECWSRALPPA